MNFLKTLGILLLIFVLVVCAIGFIQPKIYRVERKLEMNVPMQDVHMKISNWEKWKSWSPWEGADTTMYSKIEGKDGKVGSRYNWKSDNPDIGSGYMKFTDIQKDGIFFDINLKSPLQFTHKSKLILEEGINNVTKVSWVINGEISFFERVSTVFWSMDDITGQDLEKGLRKLKSLLESEYSKSESLKANEIEEFVFTKTSYLISKQRKKLSFIQAQSTIFPKLEINKLLAYANENKIKTTGAPVSLIYDLDTINQTYSLAVGFALDSFLLDSQTYSILSIEESKALKYEHIGNYNKLPSVRKKLKSYLMKEDLKLIYPVIVSYDSSELQEINAENWSTNVIYLHE